MHSWHSGSGLIRTRSVLENPKFRHHFSIAAEENGRPFQVVIPARTRPPIRFPREPEAQVPPQGG
jgi:hypothetical protein